MRPSGLQWTIGAVVAFVLGFVLVHACWTRSFPDVAAPLIVDVTFPAGIANANEPLVTTGVFADGDFLSVRYLDEKRAVLSYDVWGIGGPSSSPFDLDPGRMHRMEIALPTLRVVSKPPHGEKQRLLVRLDGRTLMDESVYFHRRRAEDIFIGVNPIGGNPATRFRGLIARADGRPLHGGPDQLFSFGARLPVLWREHGLHLLGALAFAAAAGWIAMTVAGSPWLEQLKPVANRVFVGRTTPPHAAFVVVAVLCVIGFVTLITGGTFRLIFPESFGNFYDYQAASLLHGHLDVPEAALSGEAFVVHGKYYGYFGITPALLRLPFVAAGIGFGAVSRVWMTVYYAAALAGAYLIFCQATTVICGKKRWPSGWAVTLFVTSIGLGSTLLFLGARAYIYHEAILSGIALALWSVWFALRYAQEPARRWWMGATLCGLLAVHARPPAGLFSLFLLGTIALVQVAKTARMRRRGAMDPFASATAGTFRTHALVAVLAALSFLSFNGMSYLKFGTFDGSPLRYSVQYTPERLARFDGKNFHAINFRHNFETYVVTPDFRFERHFPYMFFGSQEQRAYPEAKMDLTEPTIAFPYVMPALFLLATLGAAWSLLAAPASRRPVAFLVVGVTPMAVALFTAVVTSHRYTGDFCPALIALAAFGLAAVDADASPWRRRWLVVGGALALLSVTATVLTSLEFQGEIVWGLQAEAKHHYDSLRAAADGVFGGHRP